MKSGAMALGIVGGLLALLLGLVGFTVGQVAGWGGLKVLSLLVPVVGMIGAGMVKANGPVGSGLMAVSGIAVLGLIGVNFVGLLPAVPLLVGATLGVLGEPTSEEGTASEVETGRRSSGRITTRQPAPSSDTGE